MKCYLHVDYDPMPKQASSPADAIRMAESLLAGDGDEEPSSTWLTRWRRDELYPDNFTAYAIDELALHLQETGSVVLQRIRDDGDMGVSVEIFTDELERKNDREALDALEQGLSHELEAHGLSPARRARRVAG